MKNPKINSHQRLSLDSKQWPHPTSNVEEMEVYTLFDNLPRRLPTRKLLSEFE